LGQKSGAGFFAYAPGKDRGEPDPKLKSILEPMIRGKQKFSEETLTARLFMPMLLEATRLLADKIVRDVRDVDLGLIYGLGFPPFKGGLLFWADSLGAAKILEMLKPLESLGDRFKPTPMLVEMAASGKKLYG
jgi:3-hydroxyacyl-CoA dehydrogenase/enoyl-CoA hydratase/3-hydroxybutyryl-CoA epimerase/3-hydroxyacyl-CoA dehydrogenase/enoyl-CoA hydratase/3-hydroxybutyryl-CoA epimerase/enoyl-CoA isomerase